MPCPAATPARADRARIIAAGAVRDGDGWRFCVTVSHPETGRDDHADGGRIEAPDGTVLVERPLRIPMSRTSTEGCGDKTFALSLR